MGSVASLRLPQGFCFGTPNETHDLFAAFLNVLATSGSTIFYSDTTPVLTSDSTINSIWIKTPSSSTSDALEMYIYLQKVKGNATFSWARYYPYSIGDIITSVDGLDVTETETARVEAPNNRPFAICDGNTYGGFPTPNLTGRILFGGYAADSIDPDGDAKQIIQTVKDASPGIKNEDLANPTFSGLKHMRMYKELDGDTSFANTAVADPSPLPLLSPLASLAEFFVGGTLFNDPTLKGARKVKLKRDQVPDHTHRYGFETWNNQTGSIVNGTVGEAALSTGVTPTTLTVNTYATGGSATAKTLGRAHDNLPPCLSGLYRVYIGYGT